MLFLIVWIVPYSALGYLNELRDVSFLPMWFDDLIPLYPPATLFYILYFPLCFFTFLVVKNEIVRRNGMKAFIYGTFMAVLFFIFYPTAMPRPELLGDGFFDIVLRKFWEIDTTANAFPSQHVINSFVCAFILGEEKKKFKWAFLFLALVIAISTMFVKQHYVWDILVGFFIAFVAYFLAFKRGTSIIRS